MLENNSNQIKTLKKNNQVVFRNSSKSIKLKEKSIQWLLKYEEKCKARLKTFIWYGVLCRGGKEKLVIKDLKKTIVNYNNEDFHSFFLCLKTIPTKSKTRKKIIKEVNQYPGFFYVKMIMTKEAHKLVRSTPNIIAFVGEVKGKNQSRPLRIPFKEINKDLDRFSKKKDVIIEETIVNFKIGDFVEITKGVFEGYKARVLLLEKDSVKVEINILGDARDIEMPISHVKEIN